MFIVVIIDAESDTPGIDTVRGPFTSYEQARYEQESLRKHTSFDPELVQVARIES